MPSEPAARDFFLPVLGRAGARRELGRSLGKGLGRCLGLALVLSRSVQAQLPPNIAIDRFVVQQSRFLFATARTEFGGCLYGREHGDTLYVLYLVTGGIDPRQASDSSVLIRRCPAIRAQDDIHLVGMLHSHMRAQASCFPSGFSGGPPRVGGDDRASLAGWMRAGAQFGAILCAHGDTLSVYTLNPNDYMTMAIGPLDSLYGP